MNPKNTSRSPSRRTLPRTRGDEPGIVDAGIFEYDLYPAHAGMNPTSASSSLQSTPLPRTRGDEPT